MSVAPGHSLRAFKIAHGYVHAADVAHAAVNDAQLAVVAVVDLAGESRELNGHEGIDVNAGGAHALEERCRNVPAAHVVVNQTHLHAGPCLVDKGVGHEASQRVVADDVGFKVYVMFGPSDVPQQGVEEFIAVGMDFGLVVLERQRPVLACEKLYQHAVLLGQHEVLLFGKLEHGALSQLVHAALADILLLTRVLPEEEIKHYSYYGHEDKHHHPGHRLGRLTVVHEHGDHNHQHHTDVNHKYQPMQVYHLLNS